MLREDKKKLLSLGVVIALLAGALLCMNFTPAGEKLFDIDPDQVDQVVFRYGQFAAIDDRETIEAVVEHINGYRYNGESTWHGAPLPTKKVSLVLGEEYLDVSFNHMGVWRENEDGTTTVYSSYSWMDYFEPLVNY